MPATRKTRVRLGAISEEKLLDLRIRDLPVRVKDTWVQRCVYRLYEELEARGLTRLRPHVWPGTEWFSPDGVPGIAVPFYLLHPRLIELERKNMLTVEGGTEATCMRILRHEAGHCIDAAYRLHRRKRWRQLFGSFTVKYPATYRPDPSSRNYVLHLPLYYAQAHPAEDFAETFAVWLTPSSRWRQQYQGWPAMHKLQYVDEQMAEISDQTPPVRSTKHMEPIAEVNTTLREHYRLKRMLYIDEWPDFYDDDLRRLFSDQAAYRKQPTAASFLRAHRSHIRKAVSNWTDVHPYTIDQVLGDMVDRCRELKLRLAVPAEHASRDAVLMVTVQTMKFVSGSKHRIPI